MQEGTLIVNNCRDETKGTSVACKTSRIDERKEVISFGLLDPASDQFKSTLT